MARNAPGRKQTCKKHRLDSLRCRDGQHGANRTLTQTKARKNTRVCLEISKRLKWCHTRPGAKTSVQTYRRDRPPPTHVEVSGGPGAIAVTEVRAGGRLQPRPGGATPVARNGGGGGTHSMAPLHHDGPSTIARQSGRARVAGETRQNKLNAYQ